MSCEECGPLLRAYLDEELEGGRAVRVREHLAECNACRHALVSFEQISLWTRALPAEAEPPPHFGPNLQLRLAGLRQDAVRRRFFFPLRSRRFALAIVTAAATVAALIAVTPPRLGAQDLVGKVQRSWRELRNYSCRFVTEGIVGGKARRFEQSQWFSKPDLFRLETNKHYPQQIYLERDRVTTFIPGARWRGKRVAITRPRRAREPGLPFPFGSEWPISYDITMDALVRDLRSQRGGVLLGTEEVLGKRCYCLKFDTQHPGDRRPTHYVVWVDQDNFLPLKLKTYHDTSNQTVSSAVDLRTNVVLPAETFHYEPAPDTIQVFGDVDPFVFALGLPRMRPPDFDADPIAAGRVEMQKRAAALPFGPLAPTALPDGYALVRARAARGRWLDAYWLNDRTGAVIKLLEQPARSALPLGLADGAPVLIGSSPGYSARWRELRRPLRMEYLTWNDHGIRLELDAAGVSRNEAVQMAESLAPLTSDLEAREDSAHPRTAPQRGR